MTHLNRWTNIESTTDTHTRWTQAQKKERMNGRHRVHIVARNPVLKLKTKVQQFYLIFGLIQLEVEIWHKFPSRDLRPSFTRYTLCVQCAVLLVGDTYIHSFIQPLASYQIIRAEKHKADVKQPVFALSVASKHFICCNLSTWVKNVWCCPWGVSWFIFLLCVDWARGSAALEKLKVMKMTW